MGNGRSKHGWEDVHSSVGNADIETFEMGKDELNLSEFPIAVVAEAARPGQLTLEFSDTIKDRSTGLPVVRRVTVHGTEEWGLPAAQDDDVMIGLLQLCYLAGWPKRICFTRYQLCKLLRWSVGGASYRRIYQALHRLSTTTYNYRYGWRDKTNREWVPSLVFSYIQALKVHEADKPTKSGLCEVTWSDDFHRSLESGNLKGLDFNRFVSLRSPIAKRLYRFLDKRFGAGHSRYSCDLHTLAFEKIGVSRNYGDAAQIKRLLVPAIRELEGVGFIRAALLSERFERLGRGAWKVHFSPSRGNKEVTPAHPSLAPMKEKLIHLGIAPSEAEKFVRKFPEDYLEAKIDQFSYRQAKSNPAGLLADSIRRDLPPPGAYRTPEARAEDSLRKAEATRKQAERKAAAEAKRMAESLDEESRIDKAEAALSRLSREERAKLESEVRKRFPNAGREVAHWTMIALIRSKLDLDRE